MLIGLSLHGSQSNYYLQNNNGVASLSRGRSMSATSLGSTDQKSSNSLRYVKRSQSLNSIKKTAESQHITFDFNVQQNNTDMSVRKTGVTDNNKDQTLVPEPSYSSHALLSFLDEVEKNSNHSILSKSPFNVSNISSSSCETNVINVKNAYLKKDTELGKPKLAQQVKMLQLKLSEKEDETEKQKNTITELKAEHAKSKAEYESTVKRHQKFIDKLLNEKKDISENCALAVKEITKKMDDALKNQEDRHKVELRKAVEKQAASDKIKQDRFMDLKTKKIKEMAIKGFEPELNRVSLEHQEELLELRKIHQLQIKEVEETWQKKMRTMRNEMDAEREKAVLTERKNSRNRLEIEISELEKSYHEQRKRQLEDIHSERLRQERENEIRLMDMQRALEHKFQKLVEEHQEKIDNKEQEFQNELKTIREIGESEKIKWIKYQTDLLAEKENSIKEMYKKERDRDIELVIQRLEHEAFEREEISETKIKRLKSDYEANINELENNISGHRLKLNEARIKGQEFEDKIAEFIIELKKCHVQHKQFQEEILKLKEEIGYKENIINESATKIRVLESDLNQSKLNFETKLKTIQQEKEKEINSVYIRVKEAIKRKDEAIQSLKIERDAALEQCIIMQDC